MIDTANDCPEIIAIIEHPWGYTLEVPLEEWMRRGPGPRQGIRPHAAKCSDGRPLPFSVIPLRYRNDSLSRFLIKIGVFGDPWSSMGTTEADSSLEDHEEMERRQAEYAIVQREAQSRLLNEASPDSAADAICLLLLSVQPSFENYTSWAIFAVPDKETVIVRRIVWDRVFDSQRFFDPMKGLKYGWHTSPTIREEVTQTDHAAIDDLLKAGYSISEWPIPEMRGIVLDGVAVYLKLYAMFEDQVIDWNAVQSSDELNTWVKHVAETLDRAFT